MELLILFAIPCAFVLAAVCWRLKPRFNGSFIPLCGLLTILTGSVLGREFFSISAGPLPITIDRLILGGMSAIFIVGCWLGSQRIRSFNRLDYIVIVLQLYLSYSTVTHDWRFLDNMPASRLLFFNWLPATLYFVMRHTRVQLVDLKLVAVALGIFGAYLAITAVAEVKDITAIILPRYILTSEIREFLGRGRGPFLNPVSNGLFMTACLCCVLMAWPRFKGSTHRVLIIGLAGVIAVGIYATLTRSVWLALVVACGWFVWLPATRRQKGAMVVVATLVSIIMFPVLAEKLFSFKRDKEVSVEEMEQSAELRPMFAVIAFNMFQDNPVLGVGFGQYSQAKYPYLQDPHSGMPLSLTKGLMQHNVFLAYLTETGLIGLGILLIFLTQLFFLGWQVWRNNRISILSRQFGLLLIAVLSTYVVNGMFHDVSIIPMAQVLLFYLAGLINNISTEAFALDQGSVPIVTFGETQCAAAKSRSAVTDHSESYLPSAS